jgi:uncharacterized protein YhbP (UPF0306 family)
MASKFYAKARHEFNTKKEQDMSLQNLIITYLDEARQMQLATSQNDQPWCCTVYFAHDNAHNIYWLSQPGRRHSQEIVANPKAAAAITIQHSPGQPIRGIQVQGTAREIDNPDELRQLIEAYAERYQRFTLADEILGGASPTRLYQLKPEFFQLFDEVNYPGQPPQIWRL